MTAKIKLWQMKPIWGLPNPSPFCVKLETWLRMAEIPYEARAIAGPPKSANGKIPYVELEDGSVLGDSSFIIDALTKSRHVKLDAHLSPRDRAIGVLFQRTIEEELYFIGLYYRWVETTEWRKVRDDYFGDFPWIVRAVGFPIIRRKQIAHAHGQGVARLPEAFRLRKARDDIDTVAEILGDKPYFFGKPSSFDAVAFGSLCQAAWAPIRSPLADFVKNHDNLLAFCQRMKDRYFPELDSLAPLVGPTRDAHARPL